MPEVEAESESNDLRLFVDETKTACIVACVAERRSASEPDPRRARLFIGKDGSRVMSIDSMARLWREAAQRAGIRVSAVSDAPLTPHSGRYTFVRILEEAGFSPFWIARLRGDVQAPDPMLRAAWTYAKRSPYEIRAAYVERFPALPL